MFFIAANTTEQIIIFFSYLHSISIKCFAIKLTLLAPQIEVLTHQQQVVKTKIEVSCLSRGKFHHCVGSLFGRVHHRTEGVCSS